jgi:DNA end-binding protein Ku
MATNVKTAALRFGQSNATPASRASWCGQLQVGELCAPVKAYAAIATPPETPLRQLHAGCGKRIEYRKWCPKHGAVSQDDIVKGYPYQPEQYVELSQSELDQLQPTDDKTIHLEHFLKPSCFDPMLFAGRSLYLAAANPAARRPFAMVQRALERSGKWGLGRVVLSNRWQIVIVRPIENALLMHTLHHPALSRALPSTDAMEVKVKQAELRPLVQTINGLNGNVDWNRYRDDAESRLVAAVEGKVIATRRPRLSSTNRKRRTDNGRSTGKAKSPASNGSIKRRRRAA